LKLKAKRNPHEPGKKQPIGYYSRFLSDMRRIFGWDVSTPINGAYAIDSKTILRVDATVIVGVFILLTLTSITGQSQHTTQSQKALIILLFRKIEPLIKIGLTTVIVIPFALSAISVMIASTHGRYAPRLVWFGKFWMIFGFAYIIGGMLVLVLFSIY
jgi:hypothetical protein